MILLQIIYSAVVDIKCICYYMDISAIECLLKAVFFSMLGTHNMRWLLYIVRDTDHIDCKFVKICTRFFFCIKISLSPFFCVIPVYR